MSLQRTFTPHTLSDLYLPMINSKITNPKKEVTT